MSNPLPIVGSPYIAGVCEGKLLSFNRRSAVHVVTKDGEELVRKCYSPGIFHEFDQWYGKSPDFYLRPSGSRQERKAASRKEVDTLNLASSFPDSDRFAPELVAVYQKPKANFTNFTRRIPAQTYLDYFVHSEDSYREKATSYIDALVKLHGILDLHFEEIYRGIMNGKLPALRPRTKNDDFTRWRHYFRTIVYRASPEFTEYRSANGARKRIQNAKSDEDKRKVVHSLMDSFLRDKKITLDDFVHEFVRKDWKISYDTSAHAIDTLPKSVEAQLNVLRPLRQAGLISLIHGDISNPSNVFKVEEGRVRACDLVDLISAGPQVDVASALFNIYNFPNSAEKETTAIELIGRYVTGIQQNERIKGGTKQFTEQFIVRCLEARLKYEGVRLFAIDCKYNAQEIRSFSQWLPQYKDSDDAELSRKFLQEMFVRRFTAYADYILRGEGKAATDSFETISLLRKNVAAVEDFFTKSGVRPGLSPSAKRHERVRATARVVIPHRNLH